MTDDEPQPQQPPHATSDVLRKAQISARSNPWGGGRPRQVATENKPPILAAGEQPQAQMPETRTQGFTLPENVVVVGETIQKVNPETRFQDPVGKVEVTELGNIILLINGDKSITVTPAAFLESTKPTDREMAIKLGKVMLEQLTLGQTISYDVVPEDSDEKLSMRDVVAKNIIDAIKSSPLTPKGGRQDLIATELANGRHRLVIRETEVNVRSLESKNTERTETRKVVKAQWVTERALLEMTQGTYKEPTSESA